MVFVPYRGFVHLNLDTLLSERKITKTRFRPLSGLRSFKYNYEIDTATLKAGFRPLSGLRSFKSLINHDASEKICFRPLSGLRSFK